MKTNLLAMAAGGLFGTGLWLSQMADPTKVLAFLDIVGPWDPSLALVMGGALTAFGLTYAVSRRLKHPWLAATFQSPSRQGVDRPLLGGAVLFGIGWGLAGYCPGPALAALALNPREAAWFGLAFIAGSALMRRLR
ncbi:DUF6691 family protein [Salinisphaera sp. T31B1]|uniref:DUF6691 family protein n=1 Tax=Salinisphaera sp. T31B1 TaxID=727963 RepID=UPI00333E4E57